MKKVVGGLLAVIALLALVYFFAIDALIKTLIEREGSKYWRARIDVQSADFRLFAGSLTLRGVQLTNPRRPERNALQAETVALPLRLGAIVERRIVVDQARIEGLRFAQPRTGSGAIAGLTPPASDDPAPSDPRRMQAALRQAQQAMRSGGVPASPTGALLAPEFKPLLDQFVALLPAGGGDQDLGAWRVLIRRVDVDGEFALGESTLPFTGTLENLTPQPALFDTVTRFRLQQAPGQSATLEASGAVDARKLLQQTLRVDVHGFALRNVALSSDPALRIAIESARADLQGMLARTGAQIDIDLLMRFHDAALQATAADADSLAATAAGVLRGTREFDINFQASGDVRAPLLKLDSSLDIPLATALDRALGAQLPGR